MAGISNRFFEPDMHSSPPAGSVAICHLGEGQFHSGIVYFHTGRALLLHLAWHFQLKSDAFDAAKYAIATPPLNKNRARFVSALCRRIAFHEPRIPYAIRWVP